jgi:hypothetical protein
LICRSAEKLTNRPPESFVTEQSHGSGTHRELAITQTRAIAKYRHLFVPLFTSSHVGEPSASD